MQHPKLMESRNLPPKKGLLLYGPPGCSKTMLAKATAAESGSSFLVVKGSELLNKYVGETEGRLRELFRKARAMKPCMIFFDEIDVLGGSREKSGQHEGINTTDTLLNEMDGFEPLEGVFVLAATNRPEFLDVALLRAGRLSKTLYVGLPDNEARRKIFEMRMSTMPVDASVDAGVMSDMTKGYSGAELTQICQEASYACTHELVELLRLGENPDQHGKHYICQQHFDFALRNVGKSITPKMIQKYQDWERQREGKIVNTK